MLSQSCNKILIGKTFWKDICLPAILYASAILGYTKTEITKTEIEKLQRIENSVYRQILGAPKYAQIPTLRGEIGSSTMENRIRSNQVLFVRYVEENNYNKLMKIIIEEKRHMRKDYWATSTGEFMKKVKLSYADLKSCTKLEIKKKVKEWDTNNWIRELSEKSSLKIYREWKKEIKSEESLYDNRPSSITLRRARTNNLSLNDRKRHIGGETKCVMCNHDWEDLNHFVFWCGGYSDLRRKERLLQQPYIQDKEYLLGHLLFVDGDTIKEVLHRFWKIREKKRTTQ